MKTCDIVELIKMFGENTTLKQVLLIASDGRKFKCPKCDGKGKITVEYNGYPRGLPDSGFVYEAAFKDIECDICKGEGYTREEYKPKYIQDGFEVVKDN
jgi:hypothetical protein